MSRPLHPQETHGVRAPQPPGHVSALINLAPLWIKYTLTPRTGYSPTPRTRQRNTLPPKDKKVPVAHPPLRISSGTALSGSQASTAYSVSSALFWQWLHHLDIRWYLSMVFFPVSLFVYTRERPFQYLGGGWKAFVEQIIFFSWCK